MDTYEDVILGDVQIYPDKGMASFFVGPNGWDFTLTNFAKMYAKKFVKMTQRLWGGNLFNTNPKYFHAR